MCWLSDLMPDIQSSHISVMSARLQSSDCHTDLSISYQCDECEAAVVWLSHGLVNLVSVWWVRGCSRLTVTRTCQSRISVMSARLQSSDCHTDLSNSYQCNECDDSIVWLSRRLVNLESVWFVRGCSRLTVTRTCQSRMCDECGASVVWLSHGLSITYQCDNCRVSVVWLPHRLVNLLSVWWVWSYSGLLSRRLINRFFLFHFWKLGYSLKGCSHSHNRINLAECFQHYCDI